MANHKLTGKPHNLHCRPQTVTNFLFDTNFPFCALLFITLISKHRNSGEELETYITNYTDEWLSLCRQTETGSLQ